MSGPQPQTTSKSALGNSAANIASASVTPAAQGQLSLTMMNDLPIVTQFEVHQASIIASPDFGSGFAGSAMSQVQVALPAIEHFRTSQVHQSQVGTAPITHIPTGGHPAVMGAAACELPPGLRLLDRYEIRRKIGQGGMSTVYEAFDDVRREKVALKVLLPQLASSPQLQERFLQEGRIASNFSHPHIARVYDLHQTDSLVLLSMELLQGSTLREDMKRRKDRGQVYRPAEVLQLLREVCDALKVVHGHNVIHRDLKPENLWLGLDGSLKIMDFGIARDVFGTKFTYDGRGSGTPYYIAPEQLASSSMLDGRADQYSLAIIAYELLTGQLPQGAVTPPHLKNSAVPQKMSKAIFRALSSDAADRFPTIEAFYDAAKFRTRMPRLVKIGLWLTGLSLLGSSGYAFYEYGMPYFMPKKESPVWADLAEQTVTEHEPLKFTVRHRQSSYTSDQLKFQLLSDAPAGAEINPETGEFTWTPTEQQGPEEYEFGIMSIVESENSRSVVDKKMVKVSVREHVDAPEITAPDMLQVEELQQWSTPIVASDPNDPEFGLVYSLPTDAPEGLSIDAKTGVLSWKPNEKQGPQKYEVNVRVQINHADEKVHTEVPLVIAVSEALNPPVFSAQDTIETLEEGAVSFLASARDPNVPAIDYYYALKDAPSGMSIDPRSGQVQWTPGEQHGGKQYQVIVQACLQGDNSRNVVLSEQPFVIEVTEKIESPILHKFGAASLTAGEKLELKIEMTDPNDPPVEMTYELGPAAPSGMKIDRATGILTWEPREDMEAQQFEVPVMVRAKADARAMAQELLTVKLTKKVEPEEPAAGKPNFDLNGNGTLEANEQRIRDQFTREDRNGNGQIALNELPTSTTVGQFSKLDTNGDGWLSPAEYADLVLSGNTNQNVPPRRTGGNQGGNNNNCPDNQRPGNGNGNGKGNGGGKKECPTLELPIDLGGVPELAPILDVIVPALTDDHVHIVPAAPEMQQGVAPAPAVEQNGAVAPVPVAPENMRRVPRNNSSNRSQGSNQVRRQNSNQSQNSNRSRNSNQSQNSRRNMNLNRTVPAELQPAVELLRRARNRNR